MFFGSSAIGIGLAAWRGGSADWVDADHPVVGKLARDLDGAVADAAAGVEDQRGAAVPVGEGLGECSAIVVGAGLAEGCWRCCARARRAPHGPPCWALCGMRGVGVAHRAGLIGRDTSWCRSAGAHRQRWRAGGRGRDAVAGFSLVHARGVDHAAHGLVQPARRRGSWRAACRFHSLSRRACTGAARAHALPVAQDAVQFDPVVLVGLGGAVRRRMRRASLDRTPRRGRSSRPLRRRPRGNAPSQARPKPRRWPSPARAPHRRCAPPTPSGRARGSLIAGARMDDDGLRATFGERLRAVDGARGVGDAEAHLRRHGDVGGPGPRTAAAMSCSRRGRSSSIAPPPWRFHHLGWAAEGWEVDAVRAPARHRAWRSREQSGSLPSNAPPPACPRRCAAGWDLRQMRSNMRRGRVLETRTNLTRRGQPPIARSARHAALKSATPSIGASSRRTLGPRSVIDQGRDCTGPRLKTAWRGAQAVFSLSGSGGWRIMTRFTTQGGHNLRPQDSGNHHESGHPSQVRRRQRHLLVRQHLRDPLDHGKPQYHAEVCRPATRSIPASRRSNRHRWPRPSASARGGGNVQRAS